MDIKYNNFIGMYDGVFPDCYCQHMIYEFERILRSGHCGNRQLSEGAKKTSKQDEFYFLNLKNHIFSDFNDQSCLKIFWDGLQKCFDDYAEEYDILKDANLKCSNVKMQKTSPGGGYHVWHSEQGNGDMANRCLVYMIYLNNLDEDSAGETEFLYQRLRIPPKENTMIIWPASFTHTHRGNLVHGDIAKYVITGWFYYE
jgi:hypothetical protein